MNKPASHPLTDSGLPGVGRVPYGLHFCSFYSNRRDLVDLLVPFFKAGLENKERCLWITAPPFPASEALAELEKVVPDVSDRLRSGGLRILDAADWYGGIGERDVLQMWMDGEKQALAEGYQGLRLNGNAGFLKAEDWGAFMKYERAVNDAFGARRIVSLCSYDLRKSRATDVFEVTRIHHHTICRDTHAWEIVDGDFGPLNNGSRS